LLAICLIVFLTYINTRGIQNGKIVQLVFTSAKLIALFGLILIGLFYGLRGTALWDNFKNAWEASNTSSSTVDGVITKEWMPLSGWALAIALGASIINPLFSSDAWNNVTFIAGEIENPKRNIPLSLFWGTFIVTIIYCLANIAYLSLLPLNAIQNVPDNRVGTAAVSVIFGDTAKYIMAALIMVSTFGCNNGIILAGGRLFQTMAKDGLFFIKASETNKHGVPSYALWVQCVWACILCLSGGYGALIRYATFASLLFYILTIAGIFILRKKEPDTERPYKAFGYPIVPLLYIIITSFICFALLYNETSRKETIWGLFIVSLGIPVYYIWKDFQQRKLKSGK
jgi:APA family basic amino acid/polyamine antiporter